ncbi:hypothetical protein CKO51_06200 [Rhodopirellula sp. SM50]|nr:hypothetical protein CKO51_06200 [Rhodopirellula sp. SM50]
MQARSQSTARYFSMCTDAQTWPRSVIDLITQLQVDLMTIASAPAPDGQTRRPDQTARPDGRTTASNHFEPQYELLGRGVRAPMTAAGQSRASDAILRRRRLARELPWLRMARPPSNPRPPFRAPLAAREGHPFCQGG